MSGSVRTDTIAVWRTSRNRATLAQLHTSYTATSYFERFMQNRAFMPQFAVALADIGP